MLTCEEFSTDLSWNSGSYINFPKLISASEYLKNIPDLCCAKSSCVPLICHVSLYVALRLSALCWRRYVALRYYKVTAALWLHVELCFVELDCILFCCVTLRWVVLGHFAFLCCLFLYLSIFKKFNRGYQWAHAHPKYTAVYSQVEKTTAINIHVI